MVERRSDELAKATCSGSRAFFAGVGNSFCNPEARRSFDTVLGARLRPTSGGEVQVDRALETIDNCIALRAALVDSIRKTMQKELPP